MVGEETSWSRSRLDSRIRSQRPSEGEQHGQRLSSETKPGVNSGGSLGWGTATEVFAKMLRNLGFLLGREKGFSQRTDKVRSASSKWHYGCREDAEGGLEGGRLVRR